MVDLSKKVSLVHKGMNLKDRNFKPIKESQSRNSMNVSNDKLAFTSSEKKMSLNNSPVKQASISANVGVNDSINTLPMIAESNIKESQKDSQSNELRVSDSNVQMKTNEDGTL